MTHFEIGLAECETLDYSFERCLHTWISLQPQMASHVNHDLIVSPMIHDLIVSSNVFNDSIISSHVS